MSEQDVSLDSDGFRYAMAHFCTGVVVITAMSDEAPVGLTCQSFVSVSLEPPLILFCPAHTSTTWPKVRAAGTFCVNVLTRDQRSLGESFARSGGNKFDGVSWQLSKFGSPILPASLAHVECVIDSVTPAGDHDVVIARVIDLTIDGAGSPLLYYKSGFAYLEEN